MYNMKEDYEWFEANRDSIISNHHGQVVVIQNKQVIGYFQDAPAAVEGMKPQKIGTYIVQRCLTEQEDMSTYYTGRYAFA